LRVLGTAGLAAGFATSSHCESWGFESVSVGFVWWDVRTRSLAVVDEQKFVVKNVMKSGSVEGGWGIWEISSFRVWQARSRITHTVS
jgi:hypothetical protein